MSVKLRQVLRSPVCCFVGVAHARFVPSFCNAVVESPRALPGLLATLVCCVISVALLPSTPAQAITAPELRGQKAVQDISADMHGRDLKEKEFLKADLQGVDLSEADLRGAVINTSLLQGSDLRSADLGDVVAFASRFDGADLRDARFVNAMLMQSRFTEANIEGADFTNAVIDLPQLKAMCVLESQQRHWRQHRESLVVVDGPPSRHGDHRPWCR